MNTKRPKTAAATLVVILLVLSLAVGCTFTGVDARRPATVPDTGSAAPGGDPDGMEPLVETDGQEDQETLSPEVTLGQGLGELPEPITTWAMDYVGVMVDRYMELGAERDYLVTGAEVTGITLVPTGTAALDSALNLYRLEYRIEVDRPENVLLADGMYLDGNCITEWSSAGQPYLLLYTGYDDGQSSSERICVTNTESIEMDYSAPEMLEKYGDRYTAAAMELYALYQQSLYTLNGVSIVLEPGFTLRENAYPCFENGDGVLVGLAIVPKDELRDFSPADQPLDLESLPVNAYDCFYNSYTFEGEYHYNVFREFDAGVVVVQLSCRAYDAEFYADIFPMWASTAAPTD